MSKTTGKRGFVASQPVATISALDFKGASEAFRRAVVAASGHVDDPATDAAADAIADAADRMLSMPVSAPSDIAEKLVAYAWMNTLTADLADPASQSRIATGSNDAAKGLLAIYLDLTTRHDRTEWNAALTAFHAAQAEEDAVSEAEKDTDHTEAWNAANRAKFAALDDLLMTRAPDAAAMGEKARLAIMNLHAGWRGDDISDPAFISRLLAGEPEEVFAACIYQDGVALAGGSLDVVAAGPDLFDAGAWLAEVESRSGSTLTPSDPYGNAKFMGGDAATAEAEREALHPSHEFDVTRYACGRARQLESERERQAPPRAPTSPADLRAIFVNGLLNTFEGAEREEVRAKLAALGLEAC